MTDKFMKMRQLVIDTHKTSTFTEDEGSYLFYNFWWNLASKAALVSNQLIC